jgi:hypothetical protein
MSLLIICPSPSSATPLSSSSRPCEPGRVARDGWDPHRPALLRLSADPWSLRASVGDSAYRAIQEVMNPGF